MLSNLRTQLADIIAKAVTNCFPNPADRPGVELEIPNEKVHGDFSCNIALKSARVLKKPPQELAKLFMSAIEAQMKNSLWASNISKMEVKNPGFINFFFAPEAFWPILSNVLRQQDGYGRSDFGQKKKIQLEFVSANPTGPLSVAHARQAAVGDCLGNILNFVGYEAKKEFYVNDEGNQINILGRSIRMRALEELTGKAGDFPEECYQGDYIRDMGRDFLRRKGISSLESFEGLPAEAFSQFGVDYLMEVIKKELTDFGVQFDIWSYQSQVASLDKIETALAFLRSKDLLYEKEGALWFQSTGFGDDKDRVLRKSDGLYTYFAPDIAYHKNKFERGFEKVVNFWGPDHHGYIPRLTAAVEALGHERSALQVVIVQLATIYREGKPVSMSTRRGQYISLREVMNEVGVDAARFFFLMRSTDAHLDFDLDLAKKETAENPVFYIQYAHARIYSVLAKAGEAKLLSAEDGYTALSENEEIDLIKTIGRFPDILLYCAQQMDVFALVNYLMELATCFHRFYDKLRVVDPSNPRLSSERLALINATRIVLANGLRLVGVSVPQKM